MEAPSKFKVQPTRLINEGAKPELVPMYSSVQKVADGKAASATSMP